MWIVYWLGYGYELGWEVNDEIEAILQCSEEEGLSYIYIDV